MSTILLFLSVPCTLEGYLNYFRVARRPFPSNCDWMAGYCIQTVTEAISSGPVLFHLISPTQQMSLIEKKGLMAARSYSVSFGG